MFQKRYFIGVDIGQVADHTAIALVEAIPGEKKEDQAGPGFRLRCSFLQVLPLGIQFRDVARRLSKIEEKLSPAGSVTILVDATGPGQPVPELIREVAKSVVISCRFTSGDEPSYEWDYWKLPKAAVVTNLKIFLQDGLLEIAGKSRDPERERAINEMLVELRDFQYNQPKEGARAESFEAKVGTHDDMVTALGLACWGARRYGPWVDNDLVTVGRMETGRDPLAGGDWPDYPEDDNDGGRSERESLRE